MGNGESEMENRKSEMKTENEKSETNMEIDEHL